MGVEMIEKTEALKLLEAWRDHYYANTELIEALDPIFGGSPDGKFSDTIWRGFNEHTAALSAVLGDGSNLYWYWLENGMGTRGMAAAPPGRKLRKIKTLAQLLKLIEESRYV